VAARGRDAGLPGPGRFGCLGPNRLAASRGRQGWLAQWERMIAQTCPRFSQAGYMIPGMVLTGLRQKCWMQGIMRVGGSGRHAVQCLAVKGPYREQMALVDVSCGAWSQHPCCLWASNLHCSRGRWWLRGDQSAWPANHARKGLVAAISCCTPHSCRARDGS